MACNSSKGAMTEAMLAFPTRQEEGRDGRGKEEGGRVLCMKWVKLSFCGMSFEIGK